MSPREHASEIDQLLPSPREQHHPPKHSSDYTDGRRRWLKIAVAVVVLLLFKAFCVFSKPVAHKYHKTRERSFQPNNQVMFLNDLTLSSLVDIPIDLVSTGANNGNATSNTFPISSTQLAINLGGNMFQCSSQLMIMRHCDKDVKVRDKGGKIKVQDKRDIFGDGHCSSKGKERSAYIATLFDENNEFKNLVNGTNESIDVSGTRVPPTSAVNATEVASDPYAMKPQFQTPLKLYALNDARYNKNPRKEHSNFREVETLTPLADKFHLHVNENYGVNQEGDLAIDFFKSLSTSVKMNIGKVNQKADKMNQEDNYGEDELHTLRLCQNGMTVVNWKHSLIPNLARALGCGAKEGCPKKYQGHDFDTVWIITYKLLVPLMKTESHTPNAAPLYVKASSKGSSKTSKHSHRQLNSNSSANMSISWEISAHQVREGFDQVFKQGKTL